MGVCRLLCSQRVNILILIHPDRVVFETDDNDGVYWFGLIRVAKTAEILTEGLIRPLPFFGTTRDFK